MSNPILINLSAIFSQPTGIATYILNIIEHLQSLDPILLIAEEKQNFQCYKIPNNMTPAEGTKGHIRRLLWNQFELPKIYQKLNSSLIYSPLPEAPLYNKSRYVVMCHDLIPLRFPQKFSALTNYFRYIVPSVLDGAEHIICNSQATANDIVSFYNISPQKITPILLAYDRDNFYPQKDVDRFFLERYNILNESYFLYLGRQDPYKNLSRLITAFAHLKDCRQYKLCIAGSTDKRFTPLLQKQIEELGIEDLVKFLNYIPYQDLPKIISNSLALVFPTLWEGFGLPVLEAMACGTPVITSNLASLPEITKDSAILIDPYSILEITAAMEEVVNNSKMRDSYIKSGLERAKSFSWKKTGLATAEVLKKYINQ